MNENEDKYKEVDEKDTVSEFNYNRKMEVVREDGRKVMDDFMKLYCRQEISTYNEHGHHKRRH